VDPSADPERARAAAAEAVEVVGTDGTVERVVTRAEMRRGRLRHRCTYVVVVDADDRVVVHQRAAWKDVWPSRWDLAFGGVVAVGERWSDAAARELLEEAGIRAPLEALGRGTYDEGDVSVLGEVYLARHDGPPTFPDGEVVAAERVPRADVVRWITARPHCPDSVALAGPLLGAAGDAGGAGGPGGAG
jgi:8-oxo-dGTP pyrophosphatase MutT (NUDIX family)